MQYHMRFMNDKATKMSEELTKSPAVTEKSH